MRYYQASNRIYTMFLFVLLLVVFGFLQGEHANAVEPTSSNGEEFAYVRIFSAKIPDELGKRLDELEAIARRYGTEEVAMFLESDGPEKQANRWILRLGSEKHAYPPGLAVKARTHLRKRKQIGALQMSKDGSSATDVLAEQNAHLQWVLPESVRSPLLCDIYEDNKLRAVNTIYERLSPSGKQRWPDVIRIELPQRDWSIIQVFEYLDERPDGLDLVEQELTQHLPVEESIATPSSSEGIESLGGDIEATSDIADVSFSAYRGLGGLSWDTGWQPKNSPVQIYIGMWAGAEMSSSVWGKFILHREGDYNGKLEVGSGKGNLMMDFGVEMTAEGRVEVDLGWWDGEFQFEIPYAPNFDLRCEGEKSFNSYLLYGSSRPVVLHDDVDSAELFSVSVGGLPSVADVSVSVNAQMSLTAEMLADSISMPDGMSFVNKDDKWSVEWGSGGYSQEAQYNEDLDLTVTVTFCPSICAGIDVWIYSWEYCVPIFEVPWDIVKGPLDLPFSKHLLTFGESCCLTIEATEGGIIQPYPDANYYYVKDYDAAVIAYPRRSCLFDRFELDGNEVDAIPLMKGNGMAVLVNMNTDHTLGVFFICQACAPSVPDGAEEVGTDVVLSWTPPADANSYCVYLGTNPVVNNNPYEINEVNHCEPELEWATKYYWRVDTIGSGAGEAVCEGQKWSFTTGGKASNPDPPDNDWWIPLEPNLSWEGDSFGQSFEVYVSTNSNFSLGMIVDGNEVNKPSYQIETDMLDYNSLYYWRVDECDVNGPLCEGDVWSFTTRTSGRPYDDYVGAGHTKGPVIAWASGSAKGSNPQRTIDGSGIDFEEWTHGTELEDHWLGGPTPVNEPFHPTEFLELDAYPWIAYDFNESYELWSMWLWNFNSRGDNGMKNVRIHYSPGGDGDPCDWTWTELGTFTFDKATGENDYKGFCGPSFRGTSARAVVITAEDCRNAWGNVGLAEIKFELKAPVKAYRPRPADGTKNVPLDHCKLVWDPGAFVARHNVYFSDDEELVAEANDSVCVSKHQDVDANYYPEGGYIDDLNCSTTYYWRVDEVNDAGPDPCIWPGDVWCFTTAGYLVVDDFERYTNPDITDVWQVGTGGATIDTSTNTVNGQIHEGAQAMAYSYDNSVDPCYSEAYVDTNKPSSLVGSDWTLKDIKSLSLWFHGQGIPDLRGSFDYNDVNNGTYDVNADGFGLPISATEDQFYYVYRQTSHVTGMVTAQVLSVEETDPQSMAGVMIRQSLDPNSKYFAVVVTPKNGIYVRRRVDTGGAAQSYSNPEIAALDPPVWVRVSSSPIRNHAKYNDGSGWKEIDIPYIWPVEFTSSMFLGLCATSSSYGQMCTAEISDVELQAPLGTGIDDPTEGTDIGRIYNDPEKMYVVLEDSNNSSGIWYYPDSNDANYPDPNATQIDTWTEWMIDLNGFREQDVNIADVQRMYIGFGDRDNPMQGGSGIVFIDDIRLYPPRCIPDRARYYYDLNKDCIIDYRDVQAMASDWLLQDYDPVVVDGNISDTNLKLWYTFDPCEDFPGINIYDYSGNASHGYVPPDDPNNNPNIHDGVLTLDGNDFVDINNFDANLFNGKSDFSIAIQFKTETPGILISSARGSDSNNHSMAVYIDDWLAGGAVIYGNFWCNIVAATDDPTDKQWHTVVTTYNSETLSHRHHIYLDGRQGLDKQFDPNIPNANEDIVRIGSSLNNIFPYGTGAVDFIGDINSVQIYDGALSHGQVLYLLGYQDEVYFELDTPAELYDEEDEGQRVVNFRDYAVLANNWLEQIPLWP